MKVVVSLINRKKQRCKRKGKVRETSDCEVGPKDFYQNDSFEEWKQLYKIRRNY